jgi:hypothetical protein
MKPLTAHCRSCEAHLELRQIAQDRTGTCPQCGVFLSEPWTVLLVEECEAIEQLGNALVRSLRRLSGLPGNLEVHSDELLSNISNEVPWRQHIETEPRLVATEIQRLTEILEVAADPLPESFAHDLRTLATRLLGLASILDANQEATDPTGTGAGDAAREAASGIATAAAALERGESDAGVLRRRLADAATAT